MRYWNVRENMRYWNVRENMRYLNVLESMRIDDVTGTFKMTFGLKMYWSVLEDRRIEDDI